MRLQKWLVLLAVLLIAASGGLYLQNGGKGEAVNAVRVTQADLVQYEQATGKVKPQEEHKFYAQTSGKLLHVYVKIGDPVKQKQVLAEMDPSDTEFKLRQLESQLEQVQADWKKIQDGPKPEEVKLQEEGVHQAQIKLTAATRSWNRAKNGYDEGTVTIEELKQKEDEVKLDESALETAQINLSLIQQGSSPADTAKYEAKKKEIRVQQEQLNKDLANMQIVSDWSGTVTELSVLEGQFVAMGTQLLGMTDLSRLEIVSEVKETLIPKVFMNQQVVITGSALGNDQYTAHVTKIAPTAAPSPTSTDKKPVIDVTLALDNGSAKLLPGYNVDVNFAVSRAVSALQVPYNAVKQQDDGTSYVWTVQGARAVRTSIETGIKNNVFIEVKKGLTAGNLVIVKAPDKMKDGQKVYVNP